MLTVRQVFVVHRFFHQRPAPSAQRHAVHRNAAVAERGCLLCWCHVDDAGCHARPVGQFRDKVIAISVTARVANLDEVVGE